jgi:hypothetical protein
MTYEEHSRTCIAPAAGLYMYRPALYVRRGKKNRIVIERPAAGARAGAAEAAAAARHWCPLR